MKRRQGKPRESRSHPVVDDGLEGVLQLLPHAVALKDVDDAQEEEEALALVIPGRDATGTEKKKKNPKTRPAAILKE